MSQEEDSSQKSRIERLVARKIPIVFLNNGKYMKEEGEFSANYVILGNEKVSRVNIIGIILNNEGNMVIDDGTGNISLRVFDDSEIMKGFNIGEIVNVIGRPREYNNEIYIVPEIIKKCEEAWMRVRKIELKGFFISDKKEETEGYDEEVIEGNNNPGNQDNILEFIKKNDSGEGVEMSFIESSLKIDDLNSLVEGMVKEGEIYENRPGRIKVLE